MPLKTKIDSSGNIICANVDPDRLDQLIVERLIKPNLLDENDGNGQWWAREIRISLKLIKIYSDWDFWAKLDLGYKLNSLAFLISKRGKEILKKEYGNWSLTSYTDPAIVGEEKCGEDKLIAPKNQFDIFNI